MNTAEAASKSGEKSSEEARALAQKRKAIYLNILINLFDTVLALHWSLYNSPFSPINVALAGSVSSFAGFYRKWKNT